MSWKYSRLSVKEKKGVINHYVIRDKYVILVDTLQMAITLKSALKPTNDNLVLPLQLLVYTSQNEQSTEKSWGITIK